MLQSLDDKVAQQILPARSIEVGVGATTGPKIELSQHLLNQKRSPSEAVLRPKMSICGNNVKFSEFFGLDCCCLKHLNKQRIM